MSDFLWDEEGPGASAGAGACGGTRKCVLSAETEESAFERLPVVGLSREGKSAAVSEEFLRKLS